MDTHGDQVVTTQEAPPSHELQSKTEPEPGLRAPKRRKTGKPAAIAKFGSAAVPVYRCVSGGRERFILSYHRNGKRMRQSFCSLPAAKKEALLVAQRIQQGLQHVTDLTPADRDAYVAAKKLLVESGTGVPLVAAIEEYLKARELSGATSLLTMAAEYGKHFGSLVRGKTCLEVIREMLAAKEQDRASKAYRIQLKSVLLRFGEAFPCEMPEISTADIDAWLRDQNLSIGSRNSMLICIKVLFSFARKRGYLPADRNTAAEALTKTKTSSDTDVAIFSPEQMTRLLDASPPHLIPILAIGAFSGIRMAELARLDWSAINLERRIIEVRAGQAKTASRRVIPISDNLAAWLAPLPRQGKVLPVSDLQRESAALAKALGIGWPRNVLRHSFISYRIAIVKSAEQVALEAGNSPSIIFKHYRELVSEDVAEKWFSILPKPDQLANRTSFDRRTGVVTILAPGEEDP